MAETAAYFHVAYKRIIDNIPRIIDHDFLKSVACAMQERLMSELGLGQDNSFERASAFLSEDAAVTAQRDALTKQKERIGSVMSKLCHFRL